MRQLLFTVSLSVLFSVCLVTPCWAVRTGGIEAYEHGDFQTAFKEFRSLAGQDDSFAQFMLGYMYAHGEGLSQDYAEAAWWFVNGGFSRRPPKEISRLSLT